ncbi:hypothetical protein [Nannocystis sp.]|uniref:hypothetical protein n=1 Tax=Nannocystis sp. TaxID=1962667 RepID=UPI0025CF0C5F|nr:hypothetical protein [Nannocystis sp.]MBK7830171.1 hypothetical protein [Nannocystis sp.]
MTASLTLLAILLAAPVPTDSPPAPVADSQPVPTDSPSAAVPTDSQPVPTDSPSAAVPTDSQPVPTDSPSAPVPTDSPPAPVPVAPGPAAAAPVPADSPPAVDGPVAVTAKISPDPSQVGDLLKLELTAAYPAGYTVNLPLGLVLDPLHLVSVDEAEPESTGQGFRKVFTITAQHFAVGEARVPAFPLTYLGPDGAVQTVQVPPTPFTVSSLLANEPDPKRQLEDPPVSLEYPNRRAEIIIYSAAAALLVGLVGGLLFARWRRRPRPVVLPPPVPAHVVAYQQLDDLQKAELVARGAYQDYYLQLTEIAKGYIEGRFGIDALDRTTDELRRALEQAAAQIAPLKPTELVRFLQACDLVKFARFAPPGEEATAALEEVRKMVDATVPSAKADPKDSDDKPGPKDSSPPETKPEVAA